MEQKKIMKRAIILGYLIFQIMSVAESEQVQVIKKSTLTKGISQLLTSTSNSQTGEIFVIWVEPRKSRIDPLSSKILGKIYNSKGKPVTKTLLLAQAQDQEPNKVSVSYNPKVNEYLLVYDDSVNYPCHLFSLRLDAKGKPIGSSNKITTQSDIQTYCNNAPYLLYNPDKGNFLVFWEVHILGGCDIGRCTYQAGISLTDKGIPIGSVKPIATGFGFNSSTELDWYCGDWVYFTSIRKVIGLCGGGGLGYGGSKPGIYYLAALDPQLKGIKESDFKMINTVPIVVSSCGCDTSAHMAQIDKNSAVLFYGDSGGVVHGTKVKKTGNLSTTSFLAFSSPKENTKFYLLSAAFTDTPQGRRGILIGTERVNQTQNGHVNGPSSVWAQILDKNGQPLGQPEKILDVFQEGWIYSRITAIPHDSTASSFLFTAFEPILVFNRPEESSVARVLLKLTP